jgi:hypothetical protein
MRRRGDVFGLHPLQDKIIFRNNADIGGSIFAELFIKKTGICG